MNLSAPYIRRPVMTTLVMLTVAFFGYLAYKKLPVSDLPNVEYPTLSVRAHQPGGSPEYMANLVATPLERNLATISGLNTMTSASRLGTTQVVLNFDLNVDLNQKEVEVQRAITQTIPVLPPMPYPPTYNRSNPANTPIVFLLLTSDTATIADLYEYGHTVLAQPLSMIDGIADVEIYGIPYAVRVQADPMQLIAHHMDINELRSSLKASNPNLPGGVIRGTHRDYIIEQYGQLHTGEQYNEVVLKERNHTPLHLKDVATAISALEKRAPYFHHISKEGRKNMVILAITRLADSNTLEIARQVEEKLPILQKGIPASIKLSYFFDKAETIVASVEDVQLTLILALTLVVFVIFLYLGKFFDALIPSVVLPMTILATFIAMYLLGFNIDNLSLLALTLAIGFVVDDSIVVMENIVRHVEMGKKPYDAALEGSAQISLTVLTMTLALSAVFIPFVFMPGMMGRLFNEFSLTLIIAIFCSGLISLTLNPLLCRLFLKEKRQEHKKPLSASFNKWLADRYINILKVTIHYKKTTLAIAFSCIGLTFVVLHFLPSDFMPNSNISILVGRAMHQQGGSKRNTNRHLDILEERIKAYPFIDSFFLSGGQPTNDQGTLYAKLVPAHQRPHANTIAKIMMAELSDIPGVNLFLRPFPMINLQVGGTGGLGSYQYMLYSPDRKALGESTTKLLRAMQQMPELIGVNTNLRNQNPQLAVEFNRDRLGMYGLTLEEVEATLQSAYAGGRISTFSKGVDLYNLILEVKPEYDLVKEDLDLLMIKSKTTGELVPLNSIASWKEELGPAAVNHYNTFPSSTIAFSLAPGASLGPTLKKVKELTKELVAENVNGELVGTTRVFQETFNSLRWLILLAIFVIYVILGILYESFFQPLTILSALPIAIFGGLATLLIFHYPLSLFSAVGMIVLIGIVQKNGIMLVDFAQEAIQKENLSPIQAIIEASSARFRPIIMTTLAAILGAVPVAMGIGDNGETNRPLGLVIIGGLIFSQLVTLFVTPVVFLYMEKIEAYFTSRLFTPKEI
jgi:hydrophobic/amphiphilic exporter-1 (mainly G- bacteria), HAE1 family